MGFNCLIFFLLRYAVVCIVESLSLLYLLFLNLDLYALGHETAISNAQVTHSRITSPVPLRVKSHG